MPLAGGEHGYREIEIASILRCFVRKSRVYSGDTGFRLSDDIVRSPAVAFVSKKRAPTVHSAADFARELRTWRSRFGLLMSLSGNSCAR